MRLKRLGVITVVMAMVLSLAGLASAADGDSTEATETTEAATTIEPGSEEFPFVLLEDPAGDPLVSLVSFVLYWGTGGEGFDCSPTDATDTEPAGRCLDVSGPNGQVNHGQFMKAFVHWLKSDDGMKLLGEYYDGGGKKGHLVRQAAHNAFGKGQWKKDKGLITPTVKSLDAETLDVEGPEDDGPNHAYGHSKNKNK